MAAKKARTNPAIVAIQNLITDDEIRAILTDATRVGDGFTVRSANRALRGDSMDRLACAMILGR